MSKKNSEAEKNKPIKCYKRLYFFVVALILSFFIAISKLIEYQIIDVQKYEIESKLNNQTRQIVPAARGDIVDRYGIKLATNSLNLSLIIGEDFPLAANDFSKDKKEKDEKGNEIIYKLIKIFDEHNIDWEEDSPISKSKPYIFLENKRYEVEKLKNILKQQQYATARDSIELLIKKFNIDKNKYNEKEVRDIAVFRANMLIKDFSPYNKSFVVLNKIEPEFLDKTTGMENSLKGISIFETSNRFYPCCDVGPHFIGNVGPIYKENYETYKKKGYSPNAIVGKFGVEEKFEDYLKPTNGLISIEKDENNKTINKHFIKEPIPGNTVKLTIDYEFQKKIQEQLPEFLRSHNSNFETAKDATVCVLDVKTGEVLALVSYPSYDLNRYNEDFEKLNKEKINPHKDLALKNWFRPGSSVKPFIAIVGLLTGAITPSTVFDCRPHIFSNMDCARYNHRGRTSIYTALQHSCNNYFYQAAMKIGIDNIDKYAPYFGFGTDTGLEIYNLDGMVTNPDPEWNKKHGTTYRIGDLRQTAIGQSNFYVTILQQALCQLTIANRGKRFAAHIVKAIESPNGKAIKITKPKILSQLKIDDLTYNTVLKGMKLMASNKACLKNLDVATKSGSPQNSPKNPKLTDAAGVWFYPTKNPEIAGAIEISGGKYGEEFAANVIKIWESLKAKRNGKTKDLQENENEEATKIKENQQKEDNTQNKIKNNGKRKNKNKKSIENTLEDSKKNVEKIKHKKIAKEEI